MKFNIIGCGRLGKNLALALVNCGLSIGGIYNKHIHTAVCAAKMIGAGTACSSLNDLPPADLLFITTPDDVIENIVADIQASTIQLTNTLVVHCSGVLSSQILNPLKTQGALVASLHPQKAITTTCTQAMFNGVFFSVEGDSKGVDYLKRLVTQMGAIIFSVNPEKKASYHAASVIASNYLVTLAYWAVNLYEDAGMDTQAAKQITENLMASSLRNIINNTDCSSALTGPLQRGDIQTITKHLQTLNKHTVEDLYKALAIATLPLTHLEKNTQDKLLEILKNNPIVV
ncbi:Uncharacterized conserved protein (plasmid) [Legionella adelaidensis]|uniref:Rossmann-like domain protein n=1 Tax=Legionella adelaidensis TaxID=45056 RepID=A0A0W0R2N2_9GAMM|nr:DUF2520 domain-containing protein [Legionella adelaidensis]KTC65335.1 Rossmann-like domain protein [Legionella adelaidensis]VEH86014.1 Uncharacterized conserved protein [Legionella adelaidensis]